LGETTFSKLPPKRLKEVISQFDSAIKREFNPLDPKAETDFEIMLPLPDMPEKGITDGYFTLSKYVYL
jgi:hypothetical protein